MSPEEPETDSAEQDRTVAYQEAISELARADRPLSLQNIQITDEGYLRIFKEPPPAQFHFIARDVPCYGKVDPIDDSQEITLWAELGYIPFTIQSPDQRRQVLKVMQHARNLPTVRFVQEPGQKILALRKSAHDGVLTPQLMLTEIVLFLLEARTFIDAIGEVIAPPPIRPEVADYTRRDRGDATDDSGETGATAPTDDA